MPVYPYIVFNGNCREAVEFYAAVFETEKTKILTFGEVPPDPDYPILEDAKDLVIHTSLNIKGSKVMFSDALPGADYSPGNNISLTVVSSNLDDILYLYNRLKEGGSVDMELQETFWSKYYASLRDKFGVLWQLNYEESI
ncbi:MAG: hypothetical protein BWY11_01793 [Firmicutes bacterium ADurb.Bin182]|nr:MAG: hypothetical protein BWY11_01793 [Firmicutes bacterium ADurb.Bin182]